MFNLVYKLVTKPSAFEFAKLAFGIIVFLILLIFPFPLFVNSLLVDQYSWPILLGMLIFFVLLLNTNSPAWQTRQIAFVFALFAIPLIYKWQSAFNDGYILGGLLPWSDASGYNTGALSLLSGTLLNVWGSRRPLFAGFLAVLFKLTGWDFMIALIILTLFNTIAVFFVVRMIKERFGSISAGIFLILSFEFYARFSGVTSTEQLGFALANIALFFLLSCIRDRSFGKGLWGLALLTLALNARAGAFFILPALIVWLVFSFREQIPFKRSAGFAIAVILVVFIINIALIKMIADPKGAPFSNYSYTLYGLASGNKGWSQVLEDYPNIEEGQVMSLAVQKIRSKPLLFLQGMLGSMGDYFNSGYSGAFAFIYRGSFLPQVNFWFWGLATIGITYSISKWRDISWSFIIATFLGVISSLPLLPPIDADGMRAFAATIPFSALWIIAGVSALSAATRKLLFHQGETEERKETEPYPVKFMLFFSILIVCLAVPGPMLLRVITKRASGSVNLSLGQACDPGDTLLHGNKLRNITVYIIPDKDADESYMPFIREKDFKLAMRNRPSQYPLLDVELLNLEPGYQISSGLDPERSHNLEGSIFMVSKFLVKDHEFYACGRDSEYTHQTHGFYYLQGESAHPPSLTVLQRSPQATLVIRILYGIIIVVIVFLLLMEYGGSTPYSLARFVYTSMAMMFILPGIFVVLYSSGELAPLHLPLQQRIVLHMKQADLQTGNLYALPLGTNWMSQDALGTSPAIVYEDGTPLQSPNSIHQDIREKGQGRYSLWKGYLYFSASDNTDPRTNGRTYELEWPYPPIPIIFRWIGYLVSIVGIVLIFAGRYHLPLNNFVDRTKQYIRSRSAKIDHR